MDSVGYKSNLWNLISAIVIKSLVIIIPSFLISGILVEIFPLINIFLFKRIFYLFGSWYNLELLIVILAFAYSINYNLSNYITIKINTDSFVIRKKGKDNIIDIKTTKFIFREKFSDTTLLGKLTRNYTIQLVSQDGYVRELCCYAFNKNDYMSIKNKIENVKEML